MRPDSQFLEMRLTPTGNLAITNALVVNGSDQPLTVVNVGDFVSIQANFTGQDLPSDASYRIGFTVNGLTQYTSYVNWSAGISGTSDLDAYWGGFVATPGTNQVTVTVDPDQSVPETTYADNTFSFTFNAVSPAQGTLSYTVAQMRAAYGLNNLPDFGSAVADGTGQTIALDEAGNDPSIITDLDGFDEAMSLTTTSSQTLYQQYGPASSFVTVYNQYGTNITAEIADSGINGVPAVDPTGHWEGEETLDVEWAHAMAPGAKIDIIAVTDDANWPTNLLTGDQLAASLPGVSVISNSWGLTEWSGETAYDSSTFVSPSGHTGVTFLTASNDNGANVYPSPASAPAPSMGNDGYYPATSPYVVSVGGTQLALDSNAYGSETGWSYPTPTTTINVGSSSYTQTGTWNSQSGGFNGTYSTAAGESSSRAVWTIAVTPANTGWGTEVSATWTASAKNATNATYTIYDGSQGSGTILGTVTVDQTKVPVGTVDDSSQFQELGVFFPTLTSSGTGTLTVVLDASSANGTVIADTIGAAQAWASTGGPTPFESEPSYQLPFQSTGYRTTPDVAFDASQNSGVTCFQNGGLTYGALGTSLGSPCWAGLIAIVNQGRVANGGSTLNSTANPMQTLQALYSLPASDFRDITSGYNGFNAGAGYDLVTGLGSPIANLLIPDLASYDLPTQLEMTTPPPAGVTAGKAFVLKVAVEDGLGDVIAGYNGSVTIALADTPGDGTLGGASMVQAVDGVATFSGLTLDVAGTGYTFQASSGNLTSRTSNDIVVSPAAAYQLVIHTQPSAPATAGQAFATQPVIYEEDHFGNLETTDNTTVVTAVIESGAGPLQGKSTATVSDGVATFTNLAVDTAETISLKLTSGTLTSPTSNNILVSPAAAYQLVIHTQPSATTTAGQAFAIQPVIYEEDHFGNLETADNATVVTAVIESGAGPLHGTSTATVSDGVATFTNLADDTAETITLKFGAGSLTSTTATVRVTPLPASLLVVTIQPPNPVTSGQSFTLVVRAEDSFGNIDTNYSGNVSVSLANDPSLATSVQAQNGVATFASLTVNASVAGMAIQVSAPGLNGTATDPLTLTAVVPPPPPPPLPPPPPASTSAPTVVLEKVVYTQKTNKKGKLAGKPVFSGFSIQYNTVMNASTAGLAGNYHVFSEVVKKVKKKTVTTLKPVNFSVSYSDSSNTVTVNLKTTKPFAKGGEITISGVTSQTGVLLNPSDTVFTIFAKANGIKLG